MPFTKPAFVGQLPMQRIHFFEIHDSDWFPAALRRCVQNCLRHIWAYQAKPFQPESGTQLVARTLQRILSISSSSSSIPSAEAIRQCTFVDFCAGAGGPTPEISRHMNDMLLASSPSSSLSDKRSKGGERDDGGVHFVFTDLHPHVRAWQGALRDEATSNAASTSSKARRNHLKYVAESVDATNAPADLLSQTMGYDSRKSAIISQPITPSTQTSKKKIFRMFNLSFHHFADPLALSILRDALAHGNNSTDKGFAIFELQGRDFGSLFTVAFIIPLLLLGSWNWFWGDWTHLFFTYIIPIVPLVVWWDGNVSSLRTRTAEEVMALVERAAEELAGESEGASTAVEVNGKARGGEGGKEAVLKGWRFEHGYELHTWPGGRFMYFVGVKE